MCSMDWPTESLVVIILGLNILLAIALIFLERKDPTSTWAWILILLFIPLAGFILYLLIGRKLRKKHLFRWEGSKEIGIDKLISYQKVAIEEGSFDYRIPNAENYKELIYMNLNTNLAVLTQDNYVDIFSDGADKFESLLKDINAARDHIHIQYYIFRLDNLGTCILNALIKKAQSGVKVRVLYDEMGSRQVKKRHFKELIAAGGEVEVFFPSILPLINPRMNFRNHRKSLCAITDSKKDRITFGIHDKQIVIYFEGKGTIRVSNRFVRDSTGRRKTDLDPTRGSW